ncbi:MAG: peptidoglycan-binding protein [Candidatus Pacebacteria bacterium]|nr:peptidoglycan-binding protein [Candidatus Paceibacterota bacterium]MCF7862538.1 peptidoglycan-binding protein [Candidatus Paceibacterota bacterium]
MKKIIIALFVSVLLVGLGSSVEAIDFAGSGCKNGEKYSSTTGQLCLGQGNLPLGCTSPVGYSPLTGQSCGCNGTVYSTYNGQLCPVSNSTPTISGVSGPQSLNVGQQGTWTVTASDPSLGYLSYSVNWGDNLAVPVTGGGYSQTQQQTATFTHVYNRAGNYNPTFTVTNQSGQSAQTSLGIAVTGGMIGDLKVSISGNPLVVPYGGSTTLGWSTSGFVTGNTSCFGTGGNGTWRGAKPIQGAYATSTLYENTTFTITCSNGIGGSSVTDSVTVKVSSLTPSITVLSPNGGETWKIGDTQKIYYSYSGPKATGNFALYREGSTNRCLLGTNLLGTKEFSFDLKNISCGNGEYVSPGRYKVEALALPIDDLNIISAKDESDNYFTIKSQSTTTSTVTVLSPNGGEYWNNGGANKTITYNSKNVGDIFINLVAPESTLNNLIAINSPSGTGIGIMGIGKKGSTSYVWDGTICNSIERPKNGEEIRTGCVLVYPGNYKIHIHATETGTYGSGHEVSDISDALFTISTIDTTTPSVTVLSPNGGEQFMRGNLINTGDFLNYKVKFNSKKVGNLSNFITESNDINNWKFKKYYFVNSGQGFKPWVSDTNIGGVQINNSFNIGNYYLLSIWESQDGLERSHDFSDKSFIITTAKAIPTSPVPSAIESQPIYSTVATCTLNSITLRKGMDTEEVKCLQQMLNSKGYKVLDTSYETTYFGESTTSALKKFQAEMGLTADGILGAKTRAVLLAQ